MKKTQKSTKKETTEAVYSMPVPKSTPLYFSQTGYNNQVNRINEEEAKIRLIKAGTKDAHESEGGSQDESSIYTSIEQSVMTHQSAVNTMKKEIENFKIIPYPTSVDSVCVGCAVNIKVDNGKPTTCYIVGYGENGTDKNSVKYDAPIAKALMKQKPGYKGQFKIGNDYRWVELLGVSPIDEKPGNK